MAANWWWGFTDGYHSAGMLSSIGIDKEGQPTITSEEGLNTGMGPHGNKGPAQIDALRNCLPHSKSIVSGKCWHGFGCSWDGPALMLMQNPQPSEGGVLEDF